MHEGMPAVAYKNGMVGGYPVSLGLEWIWGRIFSTELSGPMQSHGINSYGLERKIFVQSKNVII